MNVRRREADLMILNKLYLVCVSVLCSGSRVNNFPRSRSHQSLILLTPCCWEGCWDKSKGWRGGVGIRNQTRNLIWILKVMFNASQLPKMSPRQLQPSSLQCIASWRFLRSKTSSSWMSGSLSVIFGVTDIFSPRAWRRWHSNWTEKLSFEGAYLCI